LVGLFFELGKRRMQGSHGSAYGLKYQARSIAAQVADTENTRWLVGTLSLREDNEVHLIQLADNSADILCEGLYTHQNEIWDLAACPFDSQLFSTVYASGGDFGAAIWRIPERGQGGNRVIPLQNVVNLQGHTHKIKCTLWWPSGKHNQLVSIDAENLYLWDIDTSLKTAQVHGSASAGELSHMASGCWDPHDVNHVATATDVSVQCWDLRSMK
jgi:WD40 repeat protein